MRNKKEDASPKEGPDFLKKERDTSFRALMSKDNDYIVAKQKFMGPVYDVNSGNLVNVAAKNNWVATMIE